MHPDPHCCDLVMRRRAVGRALRVSDVDGEQLASLLATVASEGSTSRSEDRELRLPGRPAGRNQKVGNRS